MAFSTLRSSDRENLFHWVGPVCKKRYCFYVNANSDYHIATIDAARMMRSVGTVTGWASEQELINLGFSNVVTFDTPQEVFQKLMDGDIPCAVLNDIAVRLLASQTGHQPKDYRKEAVLSEGQTYLAFSLDTDQQYLTAWANAYQQLVTSGELARIWKVWYPDIDW
jgi:polar amino acid transport system substrate-binding protein